MYFVDLAELLVLIAVANFLNTFVYFVQKLFSLIQKKGTTFKDIESKFPLLIHPSPSSPAQWKNIILQPSLDTALHVSARQGHVQLLR